METIYIKMTDESAYLEHHGIKGQRWGVRRYQNADGTLTAAGKSRLEDYKRKEYTRLNKKYDKKISRLEGKIKKRRESGRDTKRVVSKLQYLSGRKHIEKTALDKMTYKDMVKEKRDVGRDMVMLALGSAATVPLSVATGGTTPIIAFIPSPSGSKESSREVRLNKRIRRNPITGQVYVGRYKK